MLLKLLLLSALIAPTLHAQGSTAFDVSVVHTPKPDAEGSGIDTEDATFQAENATFKRLLEYAYDIRPDLITGIPSALENKRYDVMAKVLDPDLNALKTMTPVQRRTMLIPVLERRFALKAHVETKDLAVLELTAIGPSKLTPLPATAGDNHGTHGTRTTLQATNISIARLCTSLTNLLHKPVIDKTGLSGNYSFNLKWSP